MLMVLTVIENLLCIHTHTHTHIYIYIWSVWPKGISIFKTAKQYRVFCILEVLKGTHCCISITRGLILVGVNLSEKSLKVWDYFHIKWGLWKFFFWFMYSGNWVLLGEQFLIFWRIIMDYDSQDEGCTIFWNFRNYLLKDTLSHPRGLNLQQHCCENIICCRNFLWLHFRWRNLLTNVISLLGSIVPYKNQSCYIRYRQWVCDTRQLRIIKLSYRLVEGYQQNRDNNIIYLSLPLEYTLDSTGLQLFSVFLQYGPPA